MTATNSDRAAWAMHAITAFRHHCHGSLDPNGGPDIDEAVGDLIADLMHLCDEHDIDPFKKVKHGVSHYVVEKLDPDGMSHEADVALAAYVRRYGSGDRLSRFVWQPTIEAYTE